MDIIGVTNHFKFEAPDGKLRVSDALDAACVQTLAKHYPAIEKMPETTFDEIADKYIVMNVAHPFMEGNGCSTRIWLVLMLRRSLKKCIDWSRIDKNDYLKAMERCVVDPAPIKALFSGALTDKIDDRETLMKGTDYSYYYEQAE